LNLAKNEPFTNLVAQKRGKRCYQNRDAPYGSLNHTEIAPEPQPTRGAAVAARTYERHPLAARTNRGQIVRRPASICIRLDLDLGQAARETGVYLSRVPRYLMRTVALTLAMWRIVAARTTSRCCFSGGATQRESAGI
jgi:hypothetical protein